jgi:hypothetical protein
MRSAFVATKIPEVQSFGRVSEKYSQIFDCKPGRSLVAPSRRLSPARFMTPISDSTSSCTRRRILGWGGAGVIGGLTGYWCWPRHEGGPVTAGTPASANANPLAVQPPESLTDSPPSESPPHAGGFHREDFLPHLKSAFQLDSGTRCTLVEVSAAQKMVSPTAAFTSFSLLFTAPGDTATESKIHHLTHGQLGAMDLFLSPVGRSKEQVHLEAVYSQRV